MPVNSMTGFGRGQATNGSCEITVEIKSVNHRYLDIAFRLPSFYSQYEIPLAKLIRENFKRGRLEILVNRKDINVTELEVRLDETIYKQLIESAKTALTSVGAEDKATLRQFAVNALQRREVLDLVLKERETDLEYPLLEQALSGAVQELTKMRRSEGVVLESNLRDLLKELHDVCAQISEKAQGTVENFRDRLTKKLEGVDLAIQVDKQRLAQEVAYLAERVDITEEQTRLASHLLQFEAFLAGADGGRKLDFLLQEIGREINTIGSKAQNSAVAALVVDAKAVAEKLREQVQNIE